jgi:hypothetical protein
MSLILSAVIEIQKGCDDKIYQVFLMALDIGNTR